jgi:hypothetical protein
VRSPVSCALLFALAFAATVGVGFAGTAGPVEPGGKIGTMKVVSGEEFNADLNLFNVCNALLPRVGRYRRSCSVPRVQRMYVGYGSFEPTRKGLDELWKRTRWNLWIDGRAVSLAAFGTSDGTARRFRPTGNPAFFRLWKVILVNATPGKHTVRYRLRDRGAATDATWTVLVAK